MQDFVRRLTVSILLIPLVIVLLFFAFQPVVQYLVVLVMAVLAAVSVWEYEQLAKNKGGRMIFPFLAFATAFVVISFFIAAKAPSYHALPLVIFFIGFLGLFALHFNDKEGAVVDLAVSSFGLLYIAVPIGMMLGILYFPHTDGRIWFAYLIVVTKITDVGAYFCGTLFGKRKLAPQISPGKTVEGALCGLACALAASYGFSWVIPISTKEWFFLGFVISAVGQFGDLAESLLKRDANKKDSNTLPGLGGGLDAIDSLLFSAPVLYLYLHL